MTKVNGTVPGRIIPLAAALTMAELDQEELAVVVPLPGKAPPSTNLGGLYGILAILQMSEDRARANSDSGDARAFANLSAALHEVAADIPDVMRACRVPADLPLLTALNILAGLL